MIMHFIKNPLYIIIYVRTKHSPMLWFKILVSDDFLFFLFFIIIIIVIVIVIIVSWFLLILNV